MAKSLTIADLIYRLGLSGDDELVDKLGKVLNEADKKISKEGKASGEKGGKATGKGFSDQFKATFRGAAIGSFIGTALSQAFSSAVAATTRFVSDSVREYAVYEQGLVQLKLAGETNLAALSKRIQETAKATKVFSATDVSLAVGDLVKAGFDAETAFALVETGAIGAASEVDALSGKFGDLSGTSKALGGILRALQLDVNQSGRVMDVLARSAQDSNLNVSDLVDIIGRIGPVANLAGIEIEDLAAMAGVLSNAGMEAGSMGTALRSVLQTLISPAEGVKKQLDELGVSLITSTGEMRSFDEVLAGLSDLVAQGPRGLELLSQAFGSFGAGAAANLGSLSEELKVFQASMGNAEGAAQQLADTTRNSAAGAFAEMEARIKDAKAELGEQMMPVLLTLNESVFPPLVGILGELIQKWTDWEFIITGTTTALKQQSEALQTQLVDNLGPDLAQALNDLMDARQRVTDAQQAVDEGWFLFGLGKGGFEKELEDAKADLDVVEARYNALVKGRHNLANWSAPDQFGPQAQGAVREQTAVVQELTEAYRNLEMVEAELAAERQRFAAATTAEEERQSAARIKALEAEVAAKKGLYGQAQKAAQAAGITKDPLVEEAGRVQADLQRLKLAYEQGTISREEFVDAQEAHLRRLDGLYERAGTPQQSLAVLRARKAFLDELARLEADADRQMDVIRAVNRDREEEGRYPGTLTGANLRARIRANAKATAEAEAAARQEAWETVIQPELERLRADREALEAGERPGGGSLTPEQIQQLQRRIANREAAIARAEAEAAAAARQEAWETITRPALERLRLEREAFEAGERPGGGSLTPAEIQQLQRRMRNRADAEAAAAEEEAENERALGSTVRLTAALRDLGAATRDDVIAAVEEQISTLQRLLPQVDEGSDAWYEYVNALEGAQAALAALNAEVPEFRMPDLGSADAIRRAFSETEAMLARLRERVATETDQSVIALLEVRIQQYTELLQQLGIAVADLDKAAADGATGDEIQKQAAALASDIMRIAESLPLAIVEGIRSGDIGGALEQALGGAADYFLDMMLKSILGPITEELTAAIAKSLAAKSAGDAASGVAGAAGGLGALGPTGLIIGGVAVLASMLIGASKNRQREAERNQSSVRSTVSGAPSVTYNISAAVNVAPAANFGDPRWEAELRSFVQRVAEDLYRRVPRGGS